MVKEKEKIIYKIFLTTTHNIRQTRSLSTLLEEGVLFAVTSVLLNLAENLTEYFYKLLLENIHLLGAY